MVNVLRVQQTSTTTALLWLTAARAARSAAVHTTPILVAARCRAAGETAWFRKHGAERGSLQNLPI